MERGWSCGEGAVATMTPCQWAFRVVKVRNLVDKAGRPLHRQMLLDMAAHARLQAATGGPALAAVSTEVAIGVAAPPNWPESIRVVQVNFTNWSCETSVVMATSSSRPTSASRVGGVLLMDARAPGPALEARSRSLAGDHRGTWRRHHCAGGPGASRSQYSDVARQYVGGGSHLSGQVLARLGLGRLAHFLLGLPDCAPEPLDSLVGLGGGGLHGLAFGP